jgi:Tfp pilus assembly protein PilO
MSQSAVAQLSASFARLSSLERRFIVIVAVIVFVVINLVFVLPHFSDLGKIKTRFLTADKTLEKYNKEIAKAQSYRTNITALEGEGAAVPVEDQSVNLLGAIQAQAAQSGVTLIVNNPRPERTNEFFLERSQALKTQSGEQQLVDFLYNLGAGNSLIRVRALSIRPAAPPTGLSADATLIASFQKNPPPRFAPAPKTMPASKAVPTQPAPVANPKPPVAKPNGKPATPTKS